MPQFETGQTVMRDNGTWGRVVDVAPCGYRGHLLSVRPFSIGERRPVELWHADETSHFTPEQLRELMIIWSGAENILKRRYAVERRIG